MQCPRLLHCVPLIASLMIWPNLSTNSHIIVHARIGWGQVFFFRIAIGGFSMVFHPHCQPDNLAKSASNNLQSTCMHWLRASLLFWELPSMVFQWFATLECHCAPLIAYQWPLASPWWSGQICIQHSSEYMQCMQLHAHCQRKNLMMKNFQ